MCFVRLCLLRARREDQPSLLSFGLSPHEADCSLRISFSARNTAEDVDALVAALSAGVSRLVRMRGKR